MEKKPLPSFRVTPNEDQEREGEKKDQNADQKDYATLCRLRAGTRSWKIGGNQGTKRGKQYEGGNRLIQATGEGKLPSDKISSRRGLEVHESLRRKEY